MAQADHGEPKEGIVTSLKGFVVKNSGILGAFGSELDFVPLSRFV